MREPINYSLKHANAAVDLTVADERLIVSTRGKGLLDKLRTIDIPLSDLKNFCLVPTIGAQNIIGQARQRQVSGFSWAHLSYFTVDEPDEHSCAASGAIASSAAAWMRPRSSSSRAH